MKKKKGRADGLIEIKVEVGRSLDEKPIRKSFYGHTKKEAADKAKEYMQKRQYGEIDEKITLAEWADKWVITYKSGVRAVTFQKTYRFSIDHIIKPYFKDARLAAIRPIDIQEFFNSNMRYSFMVLQKLKNCLSSMFEAAVENELVYKNPAKKIKVESTATPMKKRAYTEEETIDIISFAKKHKYGVPIILMLKTGLRKSEMLALRWKDIDLKNNTLTVNQSVSEAPGVLEVGKPKTPASMATLPIDDDLKAVLMTIPRNITKYDYVFHKKDGDIMRPDNWVKCQYRKFMKDYKAYYMKEHDGQEPRILTPHELRHTFGSLIYEATRDIHITSRMMRHTSIMTTSKTYVHEQFETKRTAIGKVLAFRS